MEIRVNNGTLHQWDTGRTVQITVDEGDKLEQVAFSCPRAAGPVIVNPDDKGVADIPDGLLRHAGMLTVNAMLTTADRKRMTRSKDFPVVVAVRPDNYAGGSGGGSASKYKQPEWGADTAIVDILPETELTVMEEVGAALVMQEVTLTEGNVYTVNFNGTEYNCTAVYGDNLTGVSLGNVGAMMEGMPATDDPFIFMAIPEENRENFAGACAMAVPLDGSASFTLSIKGESGEIHKIPAEYAEHAPVEPFIIAATGTHPNINSGYKIDKTWNEIEQAIVSGRMVYFHYSLDMYTIANFDPDSKRVRFIRVDDNNTNETTLGIITFEVTDRGSSYGTVAIRTAYVLVSNPGNPAT